MVCLVEQLDKVAIVVHVSTAIDLDGVKSPVNQRLDITTVSLVGRVHLLVLQSGWQPCCEGQKAG
jgi:hypothetical protein